MRFACQTKFDITATGITGHCRAERMPFKDRSGQIIRDQDAWNRARNQQRNWETILQILSLRTQLFDVTDPMQDATGTYWMFEFESDRDGVFGPIENPVAVLMQDADGVPMLRELNNDPDIEPVLLTSGPRQNIWFVPMSINK